MYIYIYHGYIPWSSEISGDQKKWHIKQYRIYEKREFSHTHTKLKKKLWIPSSTKWFTVMNLCQKKSPKNEFSTHCSHTFWILDALKHSKKTNVFFATDPRVFHTWWLSQQSICHQGTPRVHPVDLEHLRGDTVAKVDGATATPK